MPTWAIILIIILLLGWGGGTFYGPRRGWYGSERTTAPGWLHILLVIAVVIIIWQLLTGQQVHIPSLR